MISWGDVEVAARAAGWKRAGREWSGPCPFCGGRDRAHVSPGDSVEVLGGCRACGAEGHKLARALTGEPSRAPALRASGLLAGFPSPDRSAGAGGDSPGSVGPLHAGRPRARTGDSRGSDLPARVWGAAGQVAGTPGAVYLAGRGVWSGEHREIRWLPSASARGCRLYPKMPAGAAGCLVYLFRGAADTSAAALQVEAVDDAGVRLSRWRYWNRDEGRDEERETKRPSVSGSDFAAGRRVFVARQSEAGRCVVCEGAIDALVVAGLSSFAGHGVRGTAGTSFFQPAAVAGCVEVVIAAQPDAAGTPAAIRLGAALIRQGLQVRILRPPDGLADWGEVPGSSFRESKGR